MLVLAALVHPPQKRISPTPPPLSEDMKKKMKEGLGLGRAVQGGTNGRVEFVNPPRKGSLYFFFAAPNMRQWFSNPTNTFLHSATALFIGGIRETVWLFLLTRPYAILSKGQYISQEKLSAQVMVKWRWIAQY